MDKEIIRGRYGDIPILTNQSKSKKMLLFLHGLDGSAAFSRPLFKKISKLKIVAMESRGHDNSPIPSSRFIGKHIKDYMDVILHYKKMGYKIWILGESMGAGYGIEIAFKTKGLIECVFAHAVPNRLVNIMVASKWTQFKVQFMTFISYLTNINYKYKASVNYSKLSSNKVLQRLARMSDKSKTREVRETLATWAINKKTWRNIKNKKPLTKIIYFQGTNDYLVDQIKAKKILSKSKIEHYFLDDANHILMYEKQFDDEVKIIKSVINKK